jgi:hypothetical protein
LDPFQDFVHWLKREANDFDAGLSLAGVDSVAWLAFQEREGCGASEEVA